MIVTDTDLLFFLCFVSCSLQPNKKHIITVKTCSWISHPLWTNPEKKKKNTPHHTPFLLDREMGRESSVSFVNRRFALLQALLKIQLPVTSEADSPRSHPSEKTYLLFLCTCFLPLETSTKCSLSRVDPVKTRRHQKSSVTEPRWV